MKLDLLNPRHYYNEFKQLKTFVITPSYSSNNELSVGQKIKGTWTVFVVKFVLAIIVGVSIGIFYDAENLTRSSMAERFSPPVLLLISILILPLLEEIAFRLSLKFKPIYLTLTLGTLGYYIASKALYHVKLSDIHDHFAERIIILFAIMIVAYPLFSIPKIKNSLELFWESNFRMIFYLFLIGFAWIHIFNYELTLEHLLLMPIITLDKLVSAMCYGYARMNYGFFYSFAIHMLTNSIGFIASMISSG
jgi:uncharacterized protein